jgi:hypothetical protein
VYQERVDQVHMDRALGTQGLQPGQGGNPRPDGAYHPHAGAEPACCCLGVSVQKALLMLLLVSVLTGIACKGGGAAADKAWDAIDLGKVDGARAKVDVLKGFLQKHPDSTHTEDAVGDVVHYLDEVLNAPQEADELLASLLGKVKDPGRRLAVQVARAGVLAKLGKVEELRALAAEISRGGALTYDQSFDVADAAVTVNAWPEALTLLDKASQLSTPEAFRAENPDRTYPEERVQRMVRWRKADVAALQGWALANSGKVAEALEVLNGARDADLKLYLGNSGTRLGGLYGRTLLLAGHTEEALKALAPEAIFGDDPEVIAAFKTAYLGTHGSEVGLDEYVEATRTTLARQVDDFELADYAGVKHRLSELRNGEVTLLAFWFPT